MLAVFFLCLVIQPVLNPLSAYYVLSKVPDLLAFFFYLWEVENVHAV